MHTLMQGRFFGNIPCSSYMTSFKPLCGLAAQTFMKINLWPCDINFRYPKNVNLILSDKTSNAVIFRMVTVGRSPIEILKNYKL